MVMRRTFIPLLQRKASAFSCQVLLEDFWSFCKAIYTLLLRRYSNSCPPFTPRNYLRCQILYVTPHQSVRVSFITLLGYDKRWTETQKSFCLVFFLWVWWCPIFFPSGWISICNNHLPKTSIPLGKLDPGCRHSKSGSALFFIIFF